MIQHLKRDISSLYSKINLKLKYLWLWILLWDYRPPNFVHTLLFHFILSSFLQVTSNLLTYSLYSHFHNPFHTLYTGCSAQAATLQCSHSSTSFSSFEPAHEIHTFEWHQHKNVIWVCLQCVKSVAVYNVVVL